MEKRQTLRFFISVILALALIAAGLIGGYQLADEIQDMVLASQDSQLLKVAQSVDNDINGHFLWYASDLSYMVTRRGFYEAEDIWRSTGDSQSILGRFEDSPLSRGDAIDTVVALRGGEALFSSEARQDYEFLDTMGESVEGCTVALCLRGDGERYVALCCGNGGELTYAALIPVDSFFSTTEHQSAASERDRIILLDATGKVFFYRDAEGIQSPSVERLSGEGRDPMGLSRLLAATDASTDFFEVRDEETGGLYTARLAILPAAANGNRCFTVGVLNNYDETATMLRNTALHLAFHVGIVVAGILLLVLELALVQRRSRQDREELALLREKAAAVEAINRQTQELAHHQRLETMGTLTSGIAHEFNNLLTPIMSYSILALEQVSEDQTQVYDSLVEIYESSRKAKNIISRLSALSRKASPETRAISPDELIRRILEVARPVKPEDVQVVEELHCGGAQTRGDDTQLSQLLLNLILNAFQAMGDRGEGTLTVSTALEGGEILIRVSDTGGGIPEEVLPHIFEPFYTTKEGGKGTGLGLAIVQQVLEEHQGSIQVDTEAGKGTTFTVCLPAIQGE